MLRGLLSWGPRSRYSRGHINTRFFSSLSKRLRSQFGMSVKDVNKTRKKLKTIGWDLDGKFDHDPIQNLRILSDYGMSAEGQKKMVLDNLLVFKVDPKTLKEKWNWYSRNFEMSNQELAKLLEKNNTLFESPLEGAVDLTTLGNTFAEMGLQGCDVRSILTSNPHLLGVSLEDNLRPRLKKLLDLGMPQSSLVTLIKSPHFFKSTHQLDSKLTFFGEVFELDLDSTVQSVLTHHPQALCYRLKRLRENLRVLTEGGLSNVHAGKVLVSAPPHKMENLKAKIWIILTVMKRCPDEITRYPKCLTSPLYHRFLIRVAFLQRVHECFDVFTLDDLFHSKDSYFVTSVLYEGCEKRFHKFAKWWLDLEDKSHTFDDFDELLELMRNRCPPKLFRSARWSGESPCSAYVF